MKFLDINFEYTDAQEERIHAPELIDSAYVDINSITEEIFKPNKYLVYGPKGAGKSALASKLKAMSESTWDFFCEVDDLEEFEFNLLSACFKSSQYLRKFEKWQVFLPCPNENALNATRPI